MLAYCCVWQITPQTVLRVSFALQVHRATGTTALIRRELGRLSAWMQEAAGVSVSCSDQSTFRAVDCGPPHSSARTAGAKTQASAATASASDAPMITAVGSPNLWAVAPIQSPPRGIMPMKISE